MRFSRRIIFILISLINFLYISFAAEALVNWVATWANVKLDFDKNLSNVYVDLTLKSNVCWLWINWFQLSWYVWTDTIWYVYFNEPDWNDNVSSCVALYWDDTDKAFVMTWIGSYEASESDFIRFDNIKFVFDKSKKKFFWSGIAYTNTIWVVNSWNNVYISWINLIDWNKTRIDYSDCSDGNNYVNWYPCYIKILLEDNAGNIVSVLDNMKVSFINIPNQLNNKLFLTTWWDILSYIKVDNWLMKIPVYILKDFSWYISIELSYDIPDTEGKYSHNIVNIPVNVISPIKQVVYENINTPIIWENVYTIIRPIFYDTWLIDLSRWYYFSWRLYIATEPDKFYFKSWQIQKDYILKFSIWPNDLNYNRSYIDISPYSGNNVFVVKFGSYFNGATWEIIISWNNMFRIYADKRVDWAKSQIVWTDFASTEFMAGDFNISPTFKILLKNHNGIIIPDVNFNMQLIDANSTNNFKNWDCDEVTNWYQTSCKSLVFEYNWQVLSWTINGKQWVWFIYKVLWSNYWDVKLVSFKPIKWGKIYFKISGLSNNNSSWTNWNNWYLSMSIKEWYIINLSYKPFLKLSLKWLNGTKNYVDVNDNFYFVLSNLSKYNIRLNELHLSWKVVEPNDGSVSIVAWYGDSIDFENIFISSNSEKDTLKTLKLSFDYDYDSGVVISYASWYYKYAIGNYWTFTLKARPEIFDLNIVFKLAGVFIDGLINKVQKWKTSVRNNIWKTNANNKIMTSLSKVYNFLNRKAHKMIAGLRPIKINWYTYLLNSNNLNWWVKYFYCPAGSDSYIFFNTWTFYGDNTILVRNCKIIIWWNLFKWDKNSRLVIFAFKDNYGIIPLDSNWWDSDTTIYINPNVSDIEASILTYGSIFTLSQYVGNWSNITYDMIFIPNRTNIINQKQLYIYWSLLSRNTIWWWFLVKEKDGNEYFTIWWWYKIKRDYNIWWNSGLDNIWKIVQAFDLNFWRWLRFGTSWWYAPDWYSIYCKNFGTNKPELCDYSVIVRYDNAIKQNILFR